MSSLLVSDIIKMAERQFEEAGVENGKTDAEIIYCYIKKLDRAKFFMQWSEPADDKTCDTFFECVARRCKREPIQHITGEQEFMGLAFKAEPGVLIPRMDSETTEQAAEELLKSAKKRNVLDLCCGSGILGISLAKRGDAKVTATDISDKAVELTKKNAKLNEVKIDVRQGDLFEPVKKKRYNLIISNPPYIRTGDIDGLQPEIKDHDPIEALDGGADGLNFYRRIAEEAPAHLKKGGTIVLEIGDDQASGVSTILEESGAFEEIEVVKDLNGLDRAVTAKLVTK